MCMCPPPPSPASPTSFGFEGFFSFPFFAILKRGGGGGIRAAWGAVLNGTLVWVAPGRGTSNLRLVCIPIAHGLSLPVIENRVLSLEFGYSYVSFLLILSGFHSSLSICPFTCKNAFFYCLFPGYDVDCVVISVSETGTIIFGTEFDEKRLDLLGTPAVPIW